MKIQLKYYSHFAQWTGKEKDTLETTYTTAREIYLFQKDLFKFTFPIESIRLAINDEFCDWDTELKEDDKLVYIAPVSGG